MQGQARLGRSSSRPRAAARVRRARHAGLARRASTSRGPPRRGDARTRRPRAGRPPSQTDGRGWTRPMRGCGSRDGRAARGPKRATGAGPGGPRGDGDAGTAGGPAIARARSAGRYAADGAAHARLALPADATALGELGGRSDRSSSACGWSHSMAATTRSSMRRGSRASSGRGERRRWRRRRWATRIRVRCIGRFWLSQQQKQAATGGPVASTAPSTDGMRRARGRRAPHT